MRHPEYAHQAAATAHTAAARLWDALADAESNDAYDALWDFAMDASDAALRASLAADLAWPVDAALLAAAETEECDSDASQHAHRDAAAAHQAAANGQPDACAHAPADPEHAAAVRAFLRREIAAL